MESFVTPTAILLMAILAASLTAVTKGLTVAGRTKAGLTTGVAALKPGRTTGVAALKPGRTTGVAAFKDGRTTGLGPFPKIELPIGGRAVASPPTGAGRTGAGRTAAGRRTPVADVYLAGALAGRTSDWAGFAATGLVAPTGRDGALLR
jgi:hypothetical protein